MIGSDWKRHAACLRLPDLHFDGSGTVDGKASIHTRLRRWRAKQVCAACPVMRECLAHAVRSEATYGVFGGLDQRERQILRGEGRPPRSAGQAALVDIAGRLELDSISWPEIEELLGRPVGPLRAALARPGRTLALREYAAWPAAWAGANSRALATHHVIPLSHADEMVRAVRMAKEEDEYAAAQQAEAQLRAG